MVFLEENNDIGDNCKHKETECEILGHTRKLGINIPCLVFGKQRISHTRNSTDTATASLLTEDDKDDKDRQNQHQAANNISGNTHNIYSILFG